MRDNNWRTLSSVLVFKPGVADTLIAPEPGQIAQTCFN